MDMQGILLFLHLIGFALWWGVSFSLALLTVRAKRSEDRAITAFTYRSARDLLKGPGLTGAVLTIVAGFGLTGMGGYGYFQLSRDHWLFGMQVLGLLAFVLTLLVQLPNAERLARAAEASTAAGEDSASFIQFQKRNGLVSSIIGLLLILSIFMGATRPG